ncbi:YciI family protein [Arthrobacter woluwensis]|uniref:Uncharacterized conserved protein n=1 Tax=Arthrobacter woluwensis TaxID=156980 RepID=A0A1H4NNF7_9MICC|nr:YciI family protein [Arthrobacter woluwensis]SEB96730.1 Uncharacterized conserved protein [Arthrobacter woluwensis]
MKFALVIFETPASRRLITQDRAAFRSHYENWISELAAAGKLLGGEALDTSPTGIRPVTLRSAGDGTTSRSAGPVVAGDETLGGWFVIEVADQAEAVDLASRLGTPETIEIHPILESAAE